MDSNPRPTEFDSAIIRAELLKRPVTATQPQPALDAEVPVEIDRHRCRVDPHRRDLSRHPFEKGGESAD